ncbi:MAG TPA: hypothetical protein VF463_06780 [Sphingobium sp.]
MPSYFLSVKATALAMMAIGCSPTFAANNLECMNLPMGAAEQTVLDRHHEARRGDDNRSAAVQTVIQSRARICAYLNGWSQPATNLAFWHRWLQVQRGLVPLIFSADEEARLKVALQPMRSRLIALFKADVSAQAKGENPPPPANDNAFQEFNVLLKTAKIPQNASNEERLGGWLYATGSQEAVVDAFSAQ